MLLLNQLINLYFTPRRRAFERFKEHPFDVQREQYARLVDAGSRTSLGRDFGISPAMPYTEFARRVPVMEYTDFLPYVERIRRGEQNVTWDSPVGWLAKSSGTTAGNSKYIPVTRDGLKNSHLRGPVDIGAIYSHLYPLTKAFGGKMLTLGGSKKLERNGDMIPSGDLSSILIDNTPNIAMNFRVPCKETALLADFDEKVKRICVESAGEDIRSFAGVPSWNLIMLERILEYTGKQNMLEVWPNVELFAHGGMSFKPYKAQYDKLFPSEQMRYLETYNASEGFFGIAEEPYTDEMLLMLDYGVFFEFWPTDSLDNASSIVPLEGIRAGVNYALVITSSNGLWRYMMGDTVKFTSCSPYKFRITGRTKLFVNAFGEEVIIDNAESAMDAACKATDAEISEYTMAPIFMTDTVKGSHQWVVSFRKAPADMEQFTDALDKALQAVNSDYEAKRRNSTTLLRPTVTVVPDGTFVDLLRTERRVGGQVKIPRLSGERTYVENLVQFARTHYSENPQ